MRRLSFVALAAALLPACTTGIYPPNGQPSATTAGGAQPSPTASGSPANPAAEEPGPVFRPGPILPTDTGATTSSPQGGAIARLPEPPQPSPAAGAAASLLTQSQRERSAGDFDRAAATLERALALAPDEPSLWVELAEVHLAQGNAVLAQETARKALTLTGEDRSLEARARRLIGR